MLNVQENIQGKSTNFASLNQRRQDSGFKARFFVLKLSKFTTVFLIFFQVNKVTVMLNIQVLFMSTQILVMIILVLCLVIRIPNGFIFSCGGMKI